MKISDKALEFIIQDVVIMDELNLETDLHGERINIKSKLANIAVNQRLTNNCAKIIPFPNKSSCSK